VNNLSRTPGINGFRSERQPRRTHEARHLHSLRTRRSHVRVVLCAPTEKLSAQNLESQLQQFSMDEVRPRVDSRGPSPEPVVGHPLRPGGQLSGDPPPAEFSHRTLSSNSTQLLTCAAHAHILDRMAKMIQVRNVPDTVHRTLKARAALAGMSLSDFLLAEIRQLAERPSLQELRERLHRREPVKLKVSAAEAVREERDAR
jgi:plasmid stability protein